MAHKGVKKKQSDKVKILPGYILDPNRRAAIVAQDVYNQFEVDFSDPDLTDTPEVVQLIDIIYFDRKQEMHEWMRRMTVQQARMFLQTSFIRRVGGKHPMTYWWKPCHYAARFNRQVLLLEIQKAGVDIYSQDGMNRTVLHYAAEHLHGELIKFICPRARFLINLSDLLGLSPFMLVCQGRQALNIELCKLMISMDGDVKAIQRFGYSALMYATKAACEENVKALLSAGSSVDIHDNCMWTPLHLCAYYGYDKIAAYLIIHGAPIEARNKDGATPLLVACQEGKAALVSVLLTRGADVNTADNYGYTPIMCAAQKGFTAIVNSLLKTGQVDLEKVTNDGFDCLMLAVQKKKTDVVKILAERMKTTPIAKDTRYGNNALILAARVGDVNALMSTLIKGIDPKQANDFGQSALVYAAETGDAATVKRLLDIGVNKEEELPNNRWTPIMIASWHGHVESVKHLLTYGVNVNAKAYNNMTALHLAAYNNHNAVVEVLVKAAFIRTNVRDDYGFTPLHLAVQLKHANVVQTLLNAGVNTEIWESHGEYLPLHTAVRNDDHGIVNLLMRHGCKVNGRQINGRTAVHFAVMDDNMAMLNVLIEKHSADINITDFSGNSALSLAIEHNAEQAFKYILSISNQIGVHMATAETKTGFTPLMKTVKLRRLDMTKALLDVGRQPVNAVDKLGRTPLFLATELEDTDAMTLLLQHASDPGIPNAKGETCLGTLVGKENIEALNVLLSKGTSILNIKDPSSNGQIPLIKAIIGGDGVMTKLLLDQPGTILDLQDNDGKNALHYAIESRKVDVVERLVKLGADTNAVDKKGMTPLHFACQLPDAAIVQLLADRGAQVVLDAAGKSPLHVLMEICNNSHSSSQNGSGGSDGSGTAEQLEIEDKIEACLRLFAKIYNNPKSREDSQRSDSKTRMPNILDTTDGGGNTILHSLVACSQPNLRFISLVITLGGSVNIKNSNGQNVLESVYSVSKLISTLAQIIEEKWRMIVKALLLKVGEDQEKIDGEISMIEYSNFGLESQQAQMMVDRWISRCQASTNGSSLGLRELADACEELELPAVRSTITKIAGGKKPVFRESILNAIETALNRELNGGTPSTTTSR